MHNERIVKSSFWANLFKQPSGKKNLPDILKDMPYFDELSWKEISALTKMVHNKIYLKGEYIFCDGDPGSGFFVVIDGNVQVVRKLNSGKEMILADFKKNDFFGELALLDEGTRNASAIAIEDSNIAVIFKQDLESFIDAFPKGGMKIYQKLSKAIATRLRDVYEEYIGVISKVNK